VPSVFPAGTLVLAAAWAQKPRHGGHAWVLLHYLLGFRRLGWDVLLLDRLDPRQCTDAAGRPCAPEDAEGVQAVRTALEQFGLGASYTVLLDGSTLTIGLSRELVLERTRRAALLLNVMGFLTDEEVLGAARQRVFLDIDPGFGQMWRELGLHDLLRGHDQYVTIAENIGRADCAIPTCGLPWVTTRPPVVLECWPATPSVPDGRFTSVASWRGAYGPLEYQGRTYGLRVHEFRRFAALPRLSGRSFQLALDIHPSERADLELLAANGWDLVDPKEVAGNPWAYRAFIQGSAAELGVAKSLYVQTRGGWFSDRSVCYLASGRPVLVQDTGLADLYPLGEGLLTFSTLDEALAGVEELAGSSERHARAARALAEACFDSDIVLGRLLTRLGVW
jgi:hypothetical protein